MPKQTIANQQLTQVERLGVRRAKAVMRLARARYLRAVAEGGLSHANIDISELTPILARGMVVAHLTGTRRSQIMAKEAGVKTAELARTLGQIEESLEAITRTKNLPALTELYARKAAGVVKKEATKINRRLRRATNLLIREGATEKEAIKVLRLELRAIGVDPLGNHRLAQVYRTQSSVAFHRARWQYERSQPELWGWEYVTAGDDRVRDEHAALDGTRLPKTSSIWGKIWPPNGYNCRCQVIPIYDKRRARRKSPPRGYEIDKDFQFNVGRIK